MKKTIIFLPLLLLSSISVEAETLNVAYAGFSFSGNYADKKKIGKYTNELLRLYKELEVYPELKETLLYLKKKKIKTCILSNGTPKLLDQLTKKAKIEKLFDSLISIEKIKIYKPDPRVYKLVTSKYSCKPSEVCFLSSNSWDVVGSRSFGFQSIWVNRVNKNFDVLDFKPKKTISDLAQLKKLI